MCSRKWQCAGPDWGWQLSRWRLFFASRSYDAVSSAAWKISAMFMHQNTYSLSICIYMKDWLKLCIIPHILKLKEIDQRSFLSIYPWKPVMYHCMDVIAKALNNSGELAALLVPEGKRVKCFLPSKALTTAAVVGFNGSYSSSAISPFVLNCQSWASDRRLRVPVIAAESCSGGKVQKGASYPRSSWRNRSSRKSCGISWVVWQHKQRYR